MIQAPTPQRDSDTIFASQAWRAAWWRHLGRERARLDLHGPHGGLGAYLARQALGPLTLITPVGAGIVSRAPITWDDPLRAAASLADAAAGADRSLWLLRHLPLHFAAALRACATDAGAHVSVIPESAAAVVDLPASWSDYVCMLSKRRRVHAARLARRWGTRRDVEIRQVHDPVAVGDAVAQLFHLARLRQVAARGRVYPFFADERILACVADAASALAAERRAFVGQLTVGSQVVAADLVFVSATAWHCFAGGFDPRWAAGSPGTWLDLQMIRAAIAAGVEQFDLGRGDARYKRWLAARRSPLSSVVLWSRRALAGRASAAVIAPGLALALAIRTPLRHVGSRRTRARRAWHASAAAPTS